jgi:hypothetical protein
MKELLRPSIKNLFWAICNISVQADQMADHRMTAANPYSSGKPQANLMGKYP